MTLRGVGICCSRFLSTSSCGCASRITVHLPSLSIPRLYATAAARSTTKRNQVARPAKTENYPRGYGLTHFDTDSVERQRNWQRGNGQHLRDQQKKHIKQMEFIRARGRAPDVYDIQEFLDSDYPGHLPPKPKRTRRKPEEAPSEESNSEEATALVPEPEPKPKPEKPPPMRPYELTQRVSKIAEEGKLYDAVPLVKNAPLASQNVIVWNTLIMYSARAGRPNAAYTLFIEMKRRGFKPIPSTWTILFQGFSQRAVEQDRTLSEVMLERISSGYAQFTRVLESLRHMDPHAVEEHIIPFNAYLDLLLNMGKYRELYDVFRGIDKYPPLKPDAVTYSIVLRCLLKRPDEAWLGETGEVKEIRDAILARKVWDQIIEGRKERIFVPVDSHLFSAMLRVLTASPRPVDHQYALDLIQEYLGLIKPGSLSPSSTAGPNRYQRGRSGQPLALTSYSFHLVLLLAGRMRRYRYVLDYLQQLQDSPWAANVLEVGHINLAINAHAELAVDKDSTDVEDAFALIEWMIRQERLDPRVWEKLLPNEETYTAMLRTCWKGRNNYEYARKTLNLMMSGGSKDFDKDGMLGRPKVVNGRTFKPNAQGMACLIRASMGDAENIHHAFRMLKHFSLDRYFTEERGGKKTRRDLRVADFYRAKLAEAFLAAKSIAGKDLPLDKEWLNEATRKSQSAIQKFTARWKAGPNLKEWMGETLDQEATRTIHPVPRAKVEKPEKRKGKGIQAHLQAA